MTDQTSVTIEVKHLSRREPLAVFEAWLNPAIAKRFLFATPEGEMVKAEIDPRVGGKFIFVDRRAGQEIAHVGSYAEIDRPRRLKFGFAVPQFSAQETEVTVKIAPVDGGCEIALTHAGVLPEYAERTAQGWTMILENLDRTLG